MTRLEIAKHIPMTRYESNIPRASCGNLKLSAPYARCQISHLHSPYHQNITRHPSTITKSSCSESPSDSDYVETDNMSANLTKQKQPAFIDIDDDSLKDLKFCMASFVAIVIIIFNYAYIMRQWVLNPNLPKSTLALYLVTLVCTILVTFGLLAKVIHPRIYQPQTVPSDKKNQ